jgi:hypothetical protein
MKLLAVLWALVAMGCAAALSAGYGPRFHAPDYVHLIGHLLLLGGLALFLERSMRWRPTTTLLVALGVGVGVELAQVAGSGVLSIREMGFDVMVDALAVMAGLALGRRRATARAIGVWLHPAFVFPVGVLGTFYAALREVYPALGWTLVAVVCLLPSAVVWLLGVRLGWFSDPDIVSRTERPRLFVAACCCSGLFVVAAHGLGAPSQVLLVAHGLALVSVLLTALTIAGFKVSGHVAIALLLAVVIAPWSIRGPVLFVAAGCLLSWGRVRARCHRPAEVVGAWALAAALGVPIHLFA